VRDCNQRTLRCIAFGTVAGNAVVDDLSKKQGTIVCPRCKGPMDEVVRIDTLQNEPGLIGYECPSCSYVTRVLIPPKSPRK
jgi:DNA-directed RNA polymerase subunit RPC12/RpoP